MLTTQRLILASQSRHRRRLLETIGLRPECLPAHIDESRWPGEAAPAMAARLAREKATAIAPQLDEALIIGCDQVAELKGHTLGKPGTPARAKAQLQACSGQSVTFYTAICLHNTRSGRFHETVDPVQVHFRHLSDSDIEAYLAREDVLDCAGSFKCEGLGICLFKAIDSRDPSSLQGLPLITLIDFLAREHFPLLGSQAQPLG